MAFQLVAKALASRSVRNAIASNGIRKLSVGALTRSAQEEGGFLAKILDVGKRFVKFIIGGLWNLFKKILDIDFSSIWTGVVQASTFLWNFNWRVSNEELDNTIKTAFDSMGGHLGQFAGSAFGWFACGAVPGLVMFTFNEALALHVLKNVGEEAFDDLVSQASSVMHSAFNATIQAGFAWSYKNARNLLLREDGLLDQAVAAGIIDGSTASNFQESAEKDEPWSFALKMEEKIESINSTFWRNFAEGFAEGASESCVEAGYVVANSLDSFFAQSSIANENSMGAQTLVEVSLPAN